MLISWDWLGQYVELDMTPDALAERLMMAGLNHESTTAHGRDWAIDLEVTSNRPDCLGHLGIARETAVLWNRALKIPAAAPKVSQAEASQLAQVRVDCPGLCPRYTARVLRGVKVGPSPAWLRDRLATIGIASINNVVDVTNYVLMECGQPLHAFDLAKLRGRQIVVREARAGETFLAINHKSYTLEPGICVIADAERAIGLGGVMGGAESEVAEGTTDVLIEAAEFDPMAIRQAARKLALHSDSSYRFERGLDPAGVDWASRRACELILEVAGGELAAGVLDVGATPSSRQSVALRLGQLKRVLGIDVPAGEAARILHALGCQPSTGSKADPVEVIPPSWRRDLTREIDLVEEVARIHGYDKIPEDARVPMASSHRTREDRVLSRARQVLCAAGCDEALTLSVVDEAWNEAFSPWTTAPALRASMPVLRRADRLRRSLVPSLLGARKTNEALANPRIELFETAKVYLAESRGLPREELLLTIASGRSFVEVKGIVEALAKALNSAARVVAKPTQQPLFESGRGAELWLVAPQGEHLWGYLGEVSAAGLKRFELRGAATVAELLLAPLVAIANLVPHEARLSVYPAVSRDLNFEVGEQVAWAEIDQTVRATAAPYLETLEFREDYRDRKHVPAGLKRLFFSFTLRSHEGTLTNDQADAIRDRIVAASHERHGARLVK